MLVYLGFAAGGSTLFASKSHDPLVLLATALLLNGLWPQAFSAVVPGGGSIATEALFYIAFPALFAFRHRLAALALICTATVLADHSMFRPIVRMMVDLFGATAEENEGLQQYFHYGLLKQLPVFIFGMVVFTLTSAPRWPTVLELLLWLFAMIVLVSGGSYHAVVAVVAGAILWVLCQFRHQSRVLEWLGQRSYSLYLFHFAVINLVVASGWVRFSGPAGLAVALVVVLSCSCGIAAMTRQLLEDRGTAMGKWLVAKLRL